ncbi:MAG: aspartate aminotransferase family protein [Actinomycetia bacterium]|nr:aspartate aminotransferase family protein [Actinomycetes bacterium]
MTDIDFSLTASPSRRLPVATHASGMRIWDSDGNEWLDACGGAMVMSLGHCHPRLVEAAQKQLEKLTFTYRFSFSNEPMIELAGLIREIAPMDRGWAFFNSSGSESVESAIHLALLYWQHVGQPAKTELISRYPSFHGSTLGALGLSGSRWRQGFEHVLDDNPVAQAPNSDIRSDRTPTEEATFGLREIEIALRARGPENVAAVFLEPISGASAAAVVPPDGYLEGVRALCDKYDVLMICDETVTGFGRTGQWWAVDHWGVQPDIVSYAKGVSSGVTPFSGLAMSGTIADVFAAAPEGFPYGHTYSGNPVGCAVAAEVIRTIRDDDLLANSTEMGKRLSAGLMEIADRSPHIGQVRGRGLLQGLELVTDKESLEPLAGASYRLAGLARDQNLMIYSCPTPLGERVIEAVMLAPPITIDERDIDEIVSRLGDAVEALSPVSPR